MPSSRQDAAVVCFLLLLAASKSVGLEVNADNVQEEEQESQDAQAQERVAILKQINRHNDDGSYTYGYEAADGSFKIETRDVLGNVKGMFGFVDEEGQLKRVSYSASNATGFQSTDGKPLTVTPPPTPPLLYQQIIRPGSGTTTTRRTPLRPYGLRQDTSTTTESTTQKSLLSEDGDEEETEVTVKPVVIQTIPRVRRPHISSTTASPEEHTTRRPILLPSSYVRHSPPLSLPIRVVNSNGQESSIPLTVPKLSPLTLGQYIRPTYEPGTSTARPDLRKLVYVTRKPPAAITEEQESSSETSEVGVHSKHDSTSKDKKEGDRRIPKGNALRRQLTEDRILNIGGIVPIPRPLLRYRQSGTDDTADVYGGTASGNERPVPDTPFRGLFTSQPRIVQNAIYQGYGSPRPRYGPGGLQVADLGETRNVPGVRIPIGPDGQYALGPGPRGDLQQQLEQLILSQQLARYRPQVPVQPLTPFQQAIMQTLLGGELPADVLQELLQHQGSPGQHRVPYGHQQVPYAPQPSVYPPQQVGYGPQQIPYAPPPQAQPVPYPTQPMSYSPPPQGMVPYHPAPQQPVPYPPPPVTAVPTYSPAQVPYSQPLPYDPQQYQPVQFPNQQVGYPYEDQQLPYHLQRRYRYRPRPGYITLPPFYQQQSPFGLRLPIPVYPYESPQVQYQGAGGARVGAPQQLMPEEYRDALLLRMLLAIRGDQEGAQQPPRTLYRSTEPTPTASTTVKPTRTPLRSVQILDPVTEEPTAKRSTNSTTSR